MLDDLELASVCSRRCHCRSRKGPSACRGLRCAPSNRLRHVEGGQFPAGLPMTDCVSGPRGAGGDCRKTIVKRKFQSCSQYQSECETRSVAEALFAYGAALPPACPCAARTVRFLRADHVDRPAQVRVGPADLADVKARTPITFRRNSRRKTRMRRASRLIGDRLLPHARSRATSGRPHIGSPD